VEPDFPIGLNPSRQAAEHVAKHFVGNLTQPGDEVIISTTKPDRYDR